MNLNSFGVDGTKYIPKKYIPKLETFSQKFSICAAVAAAVGAFWAAGLRTAAREPPPRRRRPHKYAGVLEPHTRVEARVD